MLSFAITQAKVGCPQLKYHLGWNFPPSRPFVATEIRLFFSKLRDNTQELTAPLFYGHDLLHCATPLISLSHSLPRLIGALAKDFLLVAQQDDERDCKGVWEGLFVHEVKLNVKIVPLPCQFEKERKCILVLLSDSCPRLVTLQSARCLFHPLTSPSPCFCHLPNSWKLQQSVRKETETDSICAREILRVLSGV